MPVTMAASPDTGVSLEVFSGLEWPLCELGVLILHTQCPGS